MATHRVHKTKDYTVMSNYHLRDEQMTLKTKGLLSLMLSLPDEWDYSTAGLAAIVKDGQTAIRSSLKELEALGYLKRTAVRDNGRITDWQYDIYETPMSADAEDTHDEHAHDDEPDVGFRHVENGTQLNTDTLTTEESSTKEKKASKRTFDYLIREYTNNEITIKLLGEWLKVRKAKRAAMTDYAIDLNLKKLTKLAAESKLSINAYLEEVIARGWASFFAIKNYDSSGKYKEAEKDGKNTRDTESSGNKYGLYL